MATTANDKDFIGVETPVISIGVDGVKNFCRLGYQPCERTEHAKTRKPRILDEPQQYKGMRGAHKKMVQALGGKP